MSIKTGSADGMVSVSSTAIMCSAVIVLFLLVASATAGEERVGRSHGFHHLEHHGVSSSPREQLTEGEHGNYQPQGVQTGGDYRDQSVDREVHIGGYRHGHQGPQVQETNIYGHQTATGLTRDGQSAGDYNLHGHNGVETVNQEAQHGEHHDFHGHQGSQNQASQTGVYHNIHGHQTASVLTRDGQSAGDYNLHGHNGVQTVNQEAQHGGHHNFHGHQGDQEAQKGQDLTFHRHHEVKTITQTKEVQVPYPVHVTKEVPYPVRVSVDRPVAVHVVKPYPVEVTRLVHYPVKQLVHKPYPVYKQLPYPVKQYELKPYPVHVPKPYPVYVEKTVPYPVERVVPLPLKVKVPRPVPFRVPVLKHVPYPMEKRVPVPFGVPVERPFPVPVEKPYAVLVEKRVPYVLEKEIPYPVAVPVHVPVRAHHHHPSGDCLHLQLYRDSKDRYKHGQTKASLSLQHFLGVHSGFTLDKESNTIAIICQDVTVVLAFDTRERLIQWQVKIANNLGEDEQFLVQILSAPNKGKVSPGPARLHIQEHRFCLTVGIPPRLLGHWQIQQLRKYGPVDNKFCFEGGSSCGKGEGLYVLVTDQAENITKAFRLAAEGRLAVRRRPIARNMSVMTSPRRSIHSRNDPRVSDLSCVDSASCRQSAVTVDGRCSCSRSHDNLLSWPSAEAWSQRCDFTDTASSTTEYAEKTSSWHRQETRDQERCSSCIGKIGTLSRSSTLTNTPMWPSNNYDKRHVKSGSMSLRSNYGRATTSSLDYWSSQSSSQSSVAGRLQSCSALYARPQLAKLHHPSTTSVNCCVHHRHSSYSNYDIPKPLPKRTCILTQPSLEQNGNCNFNRKSLSVTGGENYDTPRSIKDCQLQESYLQANCSTKAANLKCQCCVKPKNQQQNTSTEVEKEESRLMLCPCQRVMCWAGSWMRLPYLLTGAFRSSNTTIHKVKLDGEGKMPFVNCRGENYTCETPSKNYSIRATLEEEKEGDEIEDSSSSTKSKIIQYANVQVVLDASTEKPETIIQQEPKYTFPYVNLEYTESLKLYENSRELLKNPDMTNPVKEKNKNNSSDNITEDQSKCCLKCGHSCKKLPPKPSPKQDDYLIMEPSLGCSFPRLNSQPSSPLQSPVHERVSQSYLPMLPITIKSEEIHCAKELNEKSQSTPTLPIQKQNGLTNPSFHGSSVYHCISETNTPYPRRRLIVSGSNTAHDIKKELLNPVVRRRSSSMDSSRHLDNFKVPEEKVVSPTRTLVNTPTVSNATSIDSLSDLSMNQRPIPTSSSEHGLSRVDDSFYVFKSSSNLLGKESCKSSRTNESNIETPPSNPTIQIKRSASIPCKSVYNRDSSSSNDSGVSTGSLQLRRKDLLELDFFSNRTISMQEQLKVVKEKFIKESNCLKKSKSVDPFEEMNFEFEEVKPVKSSSAGASVPVCNTKIDSKGYLSPGGVPYIDSHSTSSGTSDMSDYIETLSLSSYSSSDTPDSFQLNHTTVNTLRPRSGKEYQTIDRNSLNPQINISSSDMNTKEGKIQETHP